MLFSIYYTTVECKMSPKFLQLKANKRFVYSIRLEFDFAKKLDPYQKVVFSCTVEFRFFENYSVRLRRGKRLWFEFSRGSKTQGFEKLEYH